MNMDRGQVSVEYMMIAVFLIVAMVIVFSTAFSTLQDQRFSHQVGTLRTTANQLADMTNFLCTSPRNTTSRKQVVVPPMTNLSTSVMENKTITFRMSSGERETVVTSHTNCNVSGTLPPTTGTFVFRGVSQGGGGGSVALNYTPEIDSLRPDTG